MPAYPTPGVYVEEIARGPRPIAAVPTNTTAMLAETERGALEPRVVTSATEFERWFGAVDGDARYAACAADGFFRNGGTRLVVCRLVGRQAASATVAFDGATLSATGPGRWGRRLWVRIEPGATATRVRMRVAYWSISPDGGLFDPFDPAHAEAALRHPPSITEVFDDLDLDPRSSNFIDRRLVDGDGRPVSALVRIDRRSPATTDGTATVHFSQALGSDGVDDPDGLVDRDDRGDVVGSRSLVQGLAALETAAYHEVSLVYAPAASPAASRLVIDHCERMRDRFAVIDCDRTVADAASLDPRTTIADTAYAAFYYPWIRVTDPHDGRPRVVPPGGHVLGLYARVDGARGVHGAPANEVVVGALGIAGEVGDALQATLNPKAVNAIRDIPGRGIRVWGARTMSTDPQWKYINVRRLFLFLERSIVEGTSWVVFELDDSRLWSRVADTIRLFLRAQWRAGALSGSTEAEAFFVTCDRATMTQDDLLGGRLICEIGIAPLRPAEFVVFRIVQTTADTVK